MGTKTIDERLSEVVKFVCQREGLDPVTLKGTEGISKLFPKDLDEVKQIKEAISYVKTYAKIKEVSKLLGSEESVRADIEEAKAHFEKLIEETQNEIATLPKAPKKMKNNLNYSYGNDFESYAVKELEKAREARKNKLLELRSNISLYKKQIRKLDDLNRTLSNPRMVVKKLFPEETMKLNGEYGKLVNMCAMSMTRENFENLLSDDERNLFEFDGQNYSVDKGNARKFLSIIKSKKAVLAIADYATKKDSYNEKQNEYNNCIINQKRYSQIVKVADTTEFATVVDKMNEISRLYKELELAEEKALRGTVFHRIRNSIRRTLDLREKEVRFSKKLHIMKDQLTDKMQDLLRYSKMSPEANMAFEAYMLARKNLEGGEKFRYGEHLDWVIDSIRFNGTERTSWPTNEVSVAELKQSAKEHEEESKEKAKELEAEIDQNKAIRDEAFEALPKRAQKILETSTPEDILKYAKKYYDYGDNNGIRLNTDIPPRAAALILEGVIKRRNMPYDRLMEIYSEVVDKEQEKIDLQKLMSQKVDSIKSGIAQMVSEHPRKDEIKSEPENETETDAREAM